MRVGYAVSEFSKADVIKELKSGVASFDKMVRRERDRNQNGGPTWWLYLYYYMGSTAEMVRWCQSSIDSYNQMLRRRRAA